MMISRIANALRRQHAYNRTTRELSRLSDRELSDLGINRGEISAVARSAL
jgi:uncharacterized protein YjiS (DUF1127 family)